MESRRLLSYSHRLLTPRLARLPPSGEGVPGPMLDMLDIVDSPNELLRPRGDEDPKLCRRPVMSLPPFATALWSKGLDAGEKEDPEEPRRSERVGVAFIGDVCRLEGLALRVVDIRYLGGVRYVVPGVAGGVAVGSMPNRARWVGVSGISEKSSFGRYRG